MNEFEVALNNHVLACWFPRAVDPSGGFVQNFNFTWQPTGDLTRGIVYQARLTWIAALLGKTAEAKHGAEFMLSKFWDSESGGFIWNIPWESPEADRSKHVYGNAFAIFALARAGFHAEAPQGVRWLVDNAKSSQGFVESVEFPGEIEDSIGTPIGLRSMNTAIHLLEAFVELYRASGDIPARDLAVEMFDLLVTRYVAPDGRLYYYLDQDFKVASDIESYGHSLETAFLLLEAAEVLHLPMPWDLAKLMVDTALVHCWDFEFGGTLYEGHAGQRANQRTKEWWTQAEAMNAYRIMAEKYGEPYQSMFETQWNRIKTFQLDPVNSGWYPSVNEDWSSVVGIKSDAWTEGYHQTRALWLASGKTL